MEEPLWERDKPARQLSKLSWGGASPAWPQGTTKVRSLSGVTRHCVPTLPEQQPV